MWPAIERFDADLAALDLEFRLSASACYSPSGAYGARPDVCPIGVLLGADGGELGSGLNVCNIPVGDDGYVQSYLSSKASDVVSQIRKITLGLRDFANEEWCALYYSSSHQWDYWATHALPRDSLPHSADVDVALLVAATSATGVDFTGNEIERRRLRLPARLRGGGVRSHVETTAAAFCGAVNQAVPRFIDRTDDAGEFVAGFFPSLASVLARARSTTATRRRATRPTSPAATRARPSSRRRGPRCARRRLRALPTKRARCSTGRRARAARSAS